MSFALLLNGWACGIIELIGSHSGWCQYISYMPRLIYLILVFRIMHRSHISYLFSSYI